MIKVDLKDKNTIKIYGHADYADYGKDIVCASVSSIVTTTINAIIEINKDSIEYKDEKDGIIIKKIKDDKITNKLLNNMIMLLEDLEKQYKNNIKIRR